MSDVVSTREFSRLLRARFGLSMTQQAIAKAAYLPKSENGKVLVEEALLCLEQRGRISIGDAAPAAPLPLLDTPETGRPRARGAALYEEQALTEALRRRKLELEIEAMEGRMVRIADVTDALVAGARRFGERIDRLALLAEEIAAAARADGTHGVRDILRRETRRLRLAIADDLKLAPSSAEDEDEDEEV